ncbi:MAG: PD-(D/E)XK nuclease family protein [Halobacteriota archaeon]|nr:PD-(D/E)XK nuclease family protein [Halobacteriota archaeon]
MPAYSHSKISVAKNCMHAFEILYLREEKDKADNDAGDKGTIVHEVLEHYVEYLHENGVGEDLEKMQYLIEKHSRDDIDDDIRHMLEFYSDSHVYDEHGTEAMFEQRLAIDENGNPVDFFDTENVWYRGVVDRMHILDDGETIRMYDYKTSRLLPSHHEWMRDRQKDGYAMLVAAHFPDAKQVEIFFDFIRWNVKLEDKIELTNDRVRKIKDRIQAEIDGIEEDIKEENFDPRPSAFCGLCSAFYECDLTKDCKTNIPSIEATAEPEEIARKLVHAKRLISELKATLKKVVDKNGSIVIEDSGWGFGLNEGADVIDTKDFIDYLVEEKGIQEEVVYDCINLSKSVVKKIQKETGVEIMNEDGTITAEFETMVIPRFSTKFDFWKKEKLRDIGETGDKS